jgi:GAF domain-containing protein
MESNDERTVEQVAAAQTRRPRWRGGLLRALLLVFLPLVVGLLVAAGLAGVIAGLTVAESQTVEELNLVATLKERQINSWLRERDRDMAVLTGDPSIREEASLLVNEGADEAERLEAYSSLGASLTQFLSKKLPFTELFLLDAAEGKVVLSTDVRQEGFLHSDEDYFRQGLLGAYLRPPELDPQLNVAAIFVARPVLAEDGSTIGVLVGRVTMGDLTVLLQDRAGMGDTGETYLVDRRLFSITGLRFGQPGQKIDTAGAHRAVELLEYGSDRYANYNGIDVFGSYRYIPRLQVALLAERSEAEALASRQILLLAAVGITLLGGLIVTGVVVFVSRRITQPVTRLTEAATEMAAGDLSQRVAISRQDEIGALSQAFDDMADRLDDVVGTLEERVADRTRDLERRAVQLATAADVGRAAASMLDLEVLTRRVADLVQDRFDLYYVGLFLLDDVGQYAMLEAGTGKPGRVMKERGHKLEVGGLSMVGAACAQRKARIALDAGEEPVRFDNPLLPETRSEMALPLMVGDRVLGALDVQSARSAAFSDEDIAVLQLVADQVAVAVDNARRFSEEAGLLEATSPLYRISHRLASAVTTEDIVQAIIDSVAETEADGCAVGRLALSPDGTVKTTTFVGAWSRQGSSEIPIGVPFSAQASPFPLQMVRTFWTIDNIDRVTRMPKGPRQFLTRFGGRSFVNVPLRAADQVIGFVSIHRVTAGAFSPVSIRLYETLVDQAAVALERARLLEDAQHRAAREQVIGEVTARMRRTLDVETVLEIAVREIGEALGLAAVDLRLGIEAE